MPHKYAVVSVLDLLIEEKGMKVKMIPVPYGRI